VAKKAKKPKAAKSMRGATKSKAPKKMRQPTQTARERKISDRILATGNDPLRVNEEFLSITLEIDATSPGVPLRLGETAARIDAARRAFQAAIMSTDSLDDWMAAARKAAQLP
jgi:hypothetical protein